MTRIIIATHKPCTLPASDSYIPVMAGAAIPGRPVPEGMTGDDSGENISLRNPGYCELTGLYWAWKNLDADNLGICHYRRYFALPGRRIMRSKDGLESMIIDGDTAGELLRRYDAILPTARNYIIETNYSQYIHSHHEADLILTREIISERHPEYLTAYDRRMAMRRGHRFNMMIMRRPLADQYCEWLFDILFELERRLDTSGYSENDRRVFGHVAERLLDVWIDANGISYIEVPYIMTENENIPRKAIGLAARKLKAARKRRAKR